MCPVPLLARQLHRWILDFAKWQGSLINLQAVPIEEHAS